jgi:conserved hypothetical protein
MDDEKAIRNVVHTWMAATKAGDSETVLGLMTDDVVFLVAGQQPFGKAAFAQASKDQAKAAVAFDGESEILELRVLGDWAYMLSKLKVIATQPGHAQAMVRAGHTLTLFRKDAGAWKIARDANLLVPISAPADGA